MGKFIDMTGWVMKEHGVPDSLLTVIERDSTIPKGQRIKWICQCECGNTISVETTKLKSGHTRSCGCLKHPDMTGWIMKEHGVPNSRLTVIKQVENANSNDAARRWLCRCECGNEKILSTTKIKTGSCLSCGCYQHDTQFIDMTGWKMSEHKQPLSKWTVLEYSKTTENYETYWLCKCECGTVREIRGKDLRNGKSLSCGCTSSKGQLAITQLLIQNNIPYIDEKTFENCRFPKTNQKARFDFYIDNKYLIEFDGSQHFYYDKSAASWNTEEHFKAVQERDTFKNQWCIDNNIPLIRIPYTRLKDLCLEDLLLETSQFIYKPDKKSN